MNRPLTLTGFLEATGAGMQIYDMGRRITRMPNAQFLAFEEGVQPWPQPLQQQAWFGVLFQPAGEEEPLIWFLRLPLDEQGKLIPASRDELIQCLLEEGAVHAGGDKPQATAQNPYSFRPRDDRLAVFHAQASVALGQSPSRYYAHARQYFSGELGWDQWPFVGLQGIADVAARLDAQTSAELAHAIPQLPSEPFNALCRCLENSVLPSRIALAVEQRLERSLDRGSASAEETSAAIRSIARCDDDHLVERLLLRTLEDAISTHPEVLAAISARVWERLLDKGLRERYLEKLAENSAGQPFFDQCLTDLLFLPGMRAPFLESLRRPDRTPSLEQAIGRFFQRLQG